MENRRRRAVAGRSGLEVRGGGLEGGRWSRLRSRRRGGHAPRTTRSLDFNANHRVNLHAPTSAGLKETMRDRNGTPNDQLAKEAPVTIDEFLQFHEERVFSDDLQRETVGRHLGDVGACRQVPESETLENLRPTSQVIAPRVQYLLGRAVESQLADIIGLDGGFVEIQAIALGGKRSDFLDVLLHLVAIAAFHVFRSEGAAFFLLHLGTFCFGT